MSPAALFKILSVLGACALICGALFAFNLHCQKKFQYRFFTLQAVAMWGVCSGSFFIGIVLLSRKASEWVAPAWWLIAIGGVLLWWILSRNLIRTNVIYGVAGTCAQAIFVLLFGSTGAFIGIMAGGVLLLALTMIAPIFLISRRR
jgi:hypothetical protein